MADEATSSRCECSHPDHFGQLLGGGAAMMPQGHGSEAAVSSVEAVTTERGTVPLCRVCREAGHMTRP
jgi:predicted aconitase with swiveling domain